MLAAVTSSEITLKGKNKRFFETALSRNIEALLADFDNVSVKKRGTSRFLVSVGEDDRSKVQEALGRVFGIDIISFVEEVPLDIGKIREAVLAHSPELRGKKIRVKAKRSDKRFPVTSQEINELVGGDLVGEGCSVDLKNPDETVHIDILQNSALISFGKTRGPGGLPVGTGGKVLSLLSGGIDSPVASWLMLKRGCSVDFLHMHAFDKDPKVARLAKRLRSYSPKPMKIFMVPYTEFYKKTLEMRSNAELLLFRRFLYKVANKIAKRKNHKAIITGDSLGQVSSQTIDNILLTNEASELPVFRPLISFNKDEIISLSEKIGTYRISLEPYKDCCSIVTRKNPATNIKTSELRKMEESLDDVLEKTLGMIEVIDV